FSKTEEQVPATEYRVLDGISYFTLLPLRALTVPVVRAFGTPAWEIMRRRAGLVLASSLESIRYATQGAGRTFITALKDKILGAPVPIEITLVGHSVGTLIISRLLQIFPEVVFKRIVYLGAACSI